MEEIESRRLVTHEKVSEGRRLFGILSMYSIRITWSFNESFTFRISKKQRNKIKDMIRHLHLS